MVTKKKLVWDKVATFELKEEFDELKEKSLPYAIKMRKAILQATKKLPDNPEIYKIDEFKKDNDKSYRVFEKYNYRIVYKISENEIRVLRVRYSRREPRIY